MNRRRLNKLRALANDPAATDAERALAREHIARIESAVGVDDVLADDCLIPVSDDLVAAMDRAMARAATVQSRAFRDARVRAAERRLGRRTMKQWRDGRGPAISKGAAR